MTQIFDNAFNVTSGFFNGTDRKYDANDISSMFDGLITDGIFEAIGDHFECTKGTDSNKLAVKVGTGKAWFDKTWIVNNESQMIYLDSAHLTRYRRDAIVIDVDKGQNRANTIQYIPGTETFEKESDALSTVSILLNDVDHKQYVLCYIIVPPDNTDSNKLNIVPIYNKNYITGPVSTIKSEEFLTEWTKNFESKYASFSKKIEEIDASFSKKIEELDATVDNKVSEGVNAWKNEQTNLWNTWMDTRKTEFDSWFGNLVTSLEGDVAANLSSKVANNTEKISRETINRLLQNGFEECEKTISEDGKTIESYSASNSTCSHITKKFNDDFSESVTTLYKYKTGGLKELAVMTKTFDSTGSVINTEIVYKQV